MLIEFCMMQYEEAVSKISTVFLASELTMYMCSLPAYEPMKFESSLVSCIWTIC